MSVNMKAGYEITEEPFEPTNLFENGGDSGDLSDGTVMFSEGTDYNLVSGSTLSTLFGKIKKLISSLKTIAFSGAYSDATGRPQYNVTDVDNDTSAQGDLEDMTLVKEGNSHLINVTVNGESYSDGFYSVPSGGNSGQVLKKSSSDSGDVEWGDAPSGIPTGGSTGQVLKKHSNTSGDVEWGDVPDELPTGGTTGQVLKKHSNTSGDVEWGDIPNELPSGGSTGQFLKKHSDTSGDVEWGDAPSGIPTGGSTGQVLKKSSDASGDVEWGDIPNELPSGGNSGQYLMKGYGQSGAPVWSTINGYNLYPRMFTFYNKLNEYSVVAYIDRFLASNFNGFVFSIVKTSDNHFTVSVTNNEDYDNYFGRVCFQFEYSGNYEPSIDSVSSQDWDVTIDYDGYISIEYYNDIPAETTVSVDIVTTDIESIYSNWLYFIDADYANLIPDGGNNGQVLKKVNGLPQWSNEAIPQGGTSGQVLAKLSNSDFSMYWKDVNEVPSTGNVGQFLKRYGSNPNQVMFDTVNQVPNASNANNGDILTADGNGNYAWQTPSSGGVTKFTGTGTINGSAVTSSVDMRGVITIDEAVSSSDNAYVEVNISSSASILFYRKSASGQQLASPSFNSVVELNNILKAYKFKMGSTYNLIRIPFMGNDLSTDTVGFGFIDVNVFIARVSDTSYRVIITMEGKVVNPTTNKYETLYMSVGGSGSTISTTISGFKL